MKAIFWRELRENLKWAALIFGILMLVVIDQIRNPSASMLFQWPLQSRLLLMPCAGLLMGVVQTLFEMRPDNWAFVVQRPVTRRRIFVAKSAAGLLLLYTVLGLPCVVIAAWAARPGNLAEPFQWRMVLPMTAYALNAGCFYFAAMVLMLRRARWYGSRVLPMGLSLLCGVLVYMFIPHFWQAVAAIALVMGIGAAAAWGAFAGNGDMGILTGPRIALGVMMYPAAVAVLAGVPGISQSFSSGPGRWQYYQVDQEGRVLRVTQTIDGSTRSWQVSDPAGNVVAGYEGVDLDDPANSNLFVRFNAGLYDMRAVSPVILGLQGLSYRDPAPGLVPLRAIAPPGVRLRYSAMFVVPERVIKLYDPDSRTLIGRVGPEGFVESGKDAASMRRFPEGAVALAGLGNRHALAFESVVYWMELDQRRVRVLFMPAGGDEVASVAELGPATNPVAAIATRHELHVLRRNGEAILAMPWSLLDVDLQKNYVQLALLPGDGRLMVQISSFPWLHEPRNEMAELAADGTVVRRTALPALSTLNVSKRREAGLMGMLFPAAAWPVLPRWLLDQVMDTRMMEYAGLFDQCMIGSAVASLLATILLGKWYGMGVVKTALWAMANGLLGPAGVVVMLGLNERPVRECCEACEKTRVIGPGSCSHCGAMAGPAALCGHEIFEPGEGLQMIHADPA